MDSIIRSKFLLAAAILLLSSCSQEEMPYSGSTIGSDRKITFRSSLPEVTSRGKDIVDTDLTYFRITAFEPEEKDSIKNGILYEYIKNDTLFKDNETGRFFADDCIWPDVGKEDHVLHFFAYYPHLASEDSLEPTFINNTKVVGSQATFDYKIDNFKVAPHITDQIDFLTAYASGSMDENEFDGIKLEFRHKLSRVEVKAKSSNKSCKLEIAGVRIGGIHTLGTYNFKAEESTGYWTLSDEKENVEYIFGPEDKIVALNYTTEAVSIMGGKNGVNYAMLLPNSYPDGWDFANDRTNSNKLMYISVLLRVIDKTPTAGEGGKPTQQYPYFDNSQGLNAMNIPREYFAVVKSSGKVSKRLYKKNDSYFSDAACTQSYTLSSGEEVREFGWASLPITGNWEAGYSYTYTLDYTSGVGLHDPSVGGTISPRAGDPIISDIVGVSVSVNDWQGLNGSTTHTVEVPGS